MKNNFIIYFLLFVLTLSCGQQSGGTTTGDPLVDVEFKSYNQSIASKLRQLIIKDALAGVNTLNFCFKRIRFKAESSSTGSDVELELGEVVIKPEGTPLGQVRIASGTYKRVEFDLEKDCDGSTKPSLTLTNDNGTYTSNDKITIRFDGQFDPTNQDLSMFVQNFINVLKNYTPGDGSLKVVMENVSGTF